MNILPIVLIIIGLYSLIYVYGNYTETFSVYEPLTIDTNENLLLRDTFQEKYNIGLGNKKYHNSIDLYNMTKSNENKVDNNNCIPFELCDSFYGYSKL
jgi:hypothetical protein